MATKKTVKKVIKKKPVKTVKKVVVKKQSEPKTMEDLLKITGYELKGLKRGQKVKGVVTDITKKMILIDIGAKTEGVVLEKEFELAMEILENLKVGDEIEAFVGSPENDRGQILLSLRQTVMNQRWELFEELFKSKKAIKVKGLEVNKGGIIVRIQGVRGFVPSSQFGRKYLGKLNDLQNQSFEVKVIEVDREKNRLIFSEKAVSEEEALVHQAKALKTVKAGDILEGVVSGIMPFGVFVRASIAGKKGKEDEGMFLEGLVHISEISWEKVDNPGVYFKAGDKIKVKVIGVDEKSKRLNLSVKHLFDDPWEKMAKDFPEGSKVKGKITKLAAFGAFVNMAPGVDGLIHISKIPADKKFEAGQEITCFVESVDAKLRRMSLSLALMKKPVGYK
ncbi:MAG: S1 RNA-binding domain-containing protein [Candidatus Beckwithbacteria bacterium]|nr:S1 RNA-binding domain-containing protein [Patescibacteria group bacterium]